MLRRVLPAGDDVIDTDDADARARIRDWYRPETPTGLRLMMIGTLDGRAAGDDGTSESLTSRLDRMILGVVREWADAVLVGAESVRREGYLLPRRSRLAVVTSSGDLSGHRLGSVASPSANSDGPQSVWVLTSAEGASRARESLGDVPHELVVLPTAADGQLAVGTIVETLHERAGSQLVCEGGPGLAAQLLQADLISELCLTIAPRVGGANLPLLGAASSASIPAEPRHLLIDDDGALYGRWSLATPGPATR